MQWIETLYIRAYSKNKRDEATQVFHELRPMLNAGNLLDVRCFTDVQLSTDLIISLTWTGVLPHRGRSRLGRQLKETFSQFGLINRVAWMEEGKGLGNKDKK